MTAAADDARTATTDYKIAVDELYNLLERLRDRELCGCCVGKALLLYGVDLIEEVLGSADAVRLLQKFVDDLRTRHVPQPPQTRTH
jgi:hypothetical protein